VTGTPQERFDRRMALARETGRRNGIINTFGGVQPGTLAMLDGLKTTSGMTMDRLLYKLARMGQKYGV
jgi:hypothetical protein